MDADSGCRFWMQILDAEDVRMEKGCAMPLSALLSSGRKGRGSEEEEEQNED